MFTYKKENKDRTETYKEKKQWPTVDGPWEISKEQIVQGLVNHGLGTHFKGDRKPLKF